MSLAHLLYRITSGPTNVKRMLTPAGLVVFFAFLGAVIGGGVALDRWLGFGRLLPRLPGAIASVPLLVGGAYLAGWSILTFIRSRGTPVPFNPPPALVTAGPYERSRNPMIAGLILQLFGLGLLIGSVGLTLIATPALLVASIAGLKLVEEPELVRRLGAPYVDYRRRTPMFLPRLGRAPRDAREPGAPVRRVSVEPVVPAVRVLFVCVENSTRSQMAEAFARIHGGGLVETRSAGSRPSGVINPRAVEVMRERGYDLSGHRSKGLDEVGSEPWDYVVTMGCGDTCPLVRASHREDWALPDPHGLSDEGLARLRDDIERRVIDLLGRLRGENRSS